MKKVALAAATLGAITSAQAGINVNIDVQYQTVALQPSSFSVVFTGTIDILIPTFDVKDASLEAPSNGSVVLAAELHPDLIAYINGDSPGVDYSGNLFLVHVPPTTPLGNYWFRDLFGGLSPMSEFFVRAEGSNFEANDNELYGVTVVPEPASMVALGLGAIGFFRRRRK